MYKQISKAQARQYYNKDIQVYIKNKNLKNEQFTKLERCYNSIIDNAFDFLVEQYKYCRCITETENTIQYFIQE